MSMGIDGSHNVMGNTFWAKHHGITEIACKQGGIDETWTDVGKTDSETTLAGLLFKSLQIDILHGFRSRIGRRWTKTFSTCNGGDGGDVCPSLRLVPILRLFLTDSEIAVSLTYHPCETQSIGLHGGKFDIFTQLAILMTNT